MTAYEKASETDDAPFLARALCCSPVDVEAVLDDGRGGTGLSRRDQADPGKDCPRRVPASEMKVAGGDPGPLARIAGGLHKSDPNSPPEKPGGSRLSVALVDFLGVRRGLGLHPEKRLALDCVLRLPRPATPRQTRPRRTYPEPSLRPDAGAPGLFAGIVGRVHICDRERALTVDLDHGVF